MSSIFCKIKAGVNNCEICNKNAYYKIKRKDPIASDFPVMELFRCGHGMCENCYNSMITYQDFKCPFCRDEGRIYKSVDGGFDSSHTFREYKDEFKNTPELIIYSQHTYVKLHRHIVGIYNMEKRALQDRKIRELRLYNLNESKKMKQISRENAVCKVCNKDTFTSQKQLWIHMRSKHPDKILTIN